jgi:hypothetical protein
MDKLFLTVTRVAAIGVLATALFVCLASLLYGLYSLTPSVAMSFQRTPTVNLDEMKAQNYSNPSPSTEVEAEQEQSQPETSKFAEDCAALLPQLNAVGARVGFRMIKEQEVLNSDTDLRSTVSKPEKNLILNNFCEHAEARLKEASLIGEPGSEVDLSGVYVSQLSKFVEAINSDANRLESMKPEDPRRYYLLPALNWFDRQFEAKARESLEHIIKRRQSQMVAKASGVAALGISGYAFAFFFLCSLILVFIRLEVNTRDIAAALEGVNKQKLAG